MKQQNFHTKKVKTLFGAIFLAYAVILTVLLLSKITVYSDDYYFGTFFDDGFLGFWEKTIDHFQNSNGRMLVHFLLEVTLLFDTKLYLFLCPLLIIGAVYFGSRLVFPKAETGEILFCHGCNAITYHRHGGRAAPLLTFVDGSFFRFYFADHIAFSSILSRAKVIGAECLVTDIADSGLSGRSDNRTVRPRIPNRFLQVWPCFLSATEGKKSSELLPYLF